MRHKHEDASFLQPRIRTAIIFHEKQVKLSNSMLSKLPAAVLLVQDNLLWQEHLEQTIWRDKVLKWKKKVPSSMPVVAQQALTCLWILHSCWTHRQCCCVNMNCNVGVFSHFMLSQRTQNTHDPQDLKMRLRWTLVTFKTQKVTFKLLYSQQYTIYIYIYIYLILTSFFLQIVQYNLSLEAVLTRSSNTHRLLRLRPDSAVFCGTRPCWSRPCCWEPALPPAWGT